jgi:hypothetical protein
VRLVQVGVDVLLVGIVGIRASANVADMAEVAAIVRLVPSLASLVDLCIGTRLYDHTSKSLKIPRSFPSLAMRLP